MSVESSYKNGVLTTLTAYATPTAPVYYGELSFSVEKVTSGSKSVPKVFRMIIKNTRTSFDTFKDSLRKNS